ncbi:uncharacterized protein LOC128551517 [Mercenaria mercenaria]|uniref:uncharacterized protein LOC128551517 n=1 Tax=Mercenaria mercenaria TaxID=6596 RepID=UPI00234F1B8E|nr:uncharacterized protein LOC128551517 [Mercenaria mercenaria]
MIKYLGLPLVAVATKFDQLCPKIYEDADYVYKSPKARDETKEVSLALGIQMRHVFPIVNYIDDRDISIGKNRLALQALNTMVQMIQDHLQHNKGIVKSNDKWEEREKRLPPLRHLNEKTITLKKLQDEMSELGDSKLRILVVGPTNSGKSSFIDSISSTLRDDIVNKAVGGRSASWGPEGVSSTEKFQMYPIKYKHESGRLKSINVSFGDTPGFQEMGGITVDHVNCKDIPYIVVLTKGDKDNQVVMTAKRRVFGSKTVKECKEKLMDLFKLRQSVIFPVVNYVHETAVDLQADALLIAAFSEILKIGMEYLEESDVES